MATGNSNEDYVEKIFEHKWVIKNWPNVVQNEALLETTNTEILCKAENLEFAKFLVGLKICQVGNERWANFTWKLLRKLDWLDNVEAHFLIQNSQMNGGNRGPFESQANAVLLKTIYIEKNFWSLAPSVYFPPMSTHSMEILVKITLKNLPKIVCYSKTKEFHKACKDEYSKNLAALLDNKLSSDVKLITKDKTEFFAHKTILCARCPVFASMLGSEFLESSTGLVNVDDISAPTMKLLLNYWYTGELQQSWTEDGVIVEFTYAAGKYQMTHILKMLDNSMGSHFTSSDVAIDLLRMVQKLSLKNAETKVLKRIIDTVTMAKNGTELLDLFSLTTDSLDVGNFTVSQLLKLFDGVLSENTDNDACSQDIKLMALACKTGVKNVESKLFKRIIDTVSKVVSAEELFALFDLNNEAHDNEYESSGLLVRANPK